MTKIILRYHLEKGTTPPLEPFGWYEAEDNYEPTNTKFWSEFEGNEEETIGLTRLSEKEITDQKAAPNLPEAILHLRQRKREQATESIVKHIKEKEVIKTTKNDDKPEMWIYKEGIYEPEAKTTIQYYSRCILGRWYTTQLGNEVIAKIMADTYTEEKEFFEEQNKNPNLLPVKNGLLNLKTKVLHPFTPEIAYFNKINAKYIPKQDCPQIKKFLAQILPGEEEQKVIQEIIGFCLLREYKYEKAIMLYGSHGRNGKSKLLELIKRFIGSNNISGVSLEDIEKDDFAISNLHNKLVNISGDISNEAIKNTGKFKSLVGRDTVSANRKYKNRVDFVNYAKIIFACNELPPVYTLSDSFWLRWVLIEFPYQFLPKKEMSLESDYVRLQDPEVLDSITSQEELDGLLNYAIEGLERLTKQKDFSTSKTAQQIRIDWQRKSNSVAAFCQDKVKEDFTSYITKADFLKEYQRYCDKYRLKQMSDKVIKNTLKDAFGVGESQQLLGESRVRIWEGVAWLNRNDS